MADARKRRGGGPKALASAVGALTRPLFTRRGLAGGAIATNWPAIVGPHLAVHTCPEKVVFPAGGRTDGTLHLRVDGGALAVELAHLEPQLLDKVNGYFGYRAVVRLRIVQGPVPHREPPPCPRPRPLATGEEKELEGRLSAIADPDLKAALEALGRAVMGRSETSAEGKK
jgi:hypothetical protein